MSANERLSTGIDGLDDLLGGGLLPGTLTAVVGSTGIGKTQFGLQFAQAGLKQEGRRGIVFDMCSRGDSQNHADYARRMFRLGVAAGRARAAISIWTTSSRLPCPAATICTCSTSTAAG